MFEILFEYWGYYKIMTSEWSKAKISDPNLMFDLIKRWFHTRLAVLLVIELNHLKDLIKKRSEFFTLKPNLYLKSENSSWEILTSLLLLLRIFELSLNSLKHSFSAWL